MVIDYKAIGKRIKIARINCDLSQDKMAEKIGLSPTHVSNIETGNTKLSLPALIHIANVLNVSADELLCDNIVKCKDVHISEMENAFKDCSPIETKILTEILSSSKKAIRDNIAFVERTQNQKIKD